MQKKLRCIIAILICFLQFTIGVNAESIPKQNDYIYSNSKEDISAPQSYTMISEVAEIKELGIKFSNITDIAVFADKLYVLDADLGCIAVVNSKYRIEKIICKELNLNQPQGLFVSEKGIYIADKDNMRIVKTDLNGKLLSEIKEPSDSKSMTTAKFSPQKIVVDSKERLYIIVADETNGIYQMDIDGNFLGFFGSVPVVPSLTELFWRSISTKAQLERMLLFVPTEYSNMDIDSEGFIYTTTSTNTAEEMAAYISSGSSSSNLAPIRRHNPKNNDVLVRNGIMPPAGDMVDDTASRFIDIAVRNDGTYCALDSSFARVFTYNKDGELLFIFGEENEKKSGFSKPSSICWWDNNIVVADRGNCAVKIFSPTEYANIIYQALDNEDAGNYEESKTLWNKLLNIHPGNGLAYLGIGKQEMRDGNYSAAMKWFKKAESQTYYSKALKLQRQEVGYTIIGAVIILIVLLVIAAFVFKIIRKKHPAKAKKPENAMWKSIKYGFHIMTHPFDGFENMQREGGCSVASATIVIGALIILNVISFVATGYIISGNSKITQSIIIKGILGIALPFFLWCIANWSVTSLMNGSGTFKRIYIYSCYSLFPLLISTPILTVISHFVSVDEIALYNIINTIFYIWTGLLLFCGTVVIHEYTASRTLITIVLIVIAMGIIIFLSLLCVTILQQITEFLKLLFEEIKLRL